MLKLYHSHSDKSIAEMKCFSPAYLSRKVHIYVLIYLEKGRLDLKGIVEERAIKLGEYIVENKYTVRKAAAKFGISKSTVHKDVTDRLKTINPWLYREVGRVLEQNKQERHMRGGEATRQKYIETGKVVDGFESNYKFSTAGNVLNTPIGFNNRENIVPTTVTFDDASVTAGTKGLYRTSADAPGGIAANTKAALKTKGNWRSVSRTSTTATLSAASRLERLTDYSNRTDFTHKMSTIDSTYYNQVKEQIGVKLLQVGYQTLPCVREFLAKLPNIYITTEWNDCDFTINTQNFDINNDLYIQGIVVWIIPTDSNNIESMRVYPCHMIDHELPLIAGLRLINERSQGTTVYDWNMLNVVNPAQMSLNPLIENMGLISFSPTLTANLLPLAYYDSNISGYLKGELLSGDGDTNIGTAVNIKQGYIKILTIGVNGVASVNLNLFRLVF